MNIYRSHVLVCGGEGCQASGAQAVFDRFEKEIKKNGLQNEVKVVMTGCFGLCEAGPVVVVYPRRVFLQQDRGKRRTDHRQRTSVKRKRRQRPVVQGRRRRCGEIAGQYRIFSRNKNGWR